MARNLVLCIVPISLCLPYLSHQQLWLGPHVSELFFHLHVFEAFCSRALGCCTGKIKYDKCTLF